jgi:hypothetical protein
MGEIDWPFVGTEALASGDVTRRQLGSQYRAVYRNVYVPMDDELTAVTRARAAWLWAGRRATLAGMSAAAVHGSLWIDPNLPAELIRIGHPADGLIVHRDNLSDDEVCVVDGMPVTTPVRTAFDIGRQNGLKNAVARLDALARATGVQQADIAALAKRKRGARGIVQLREALDLVDGGAESPQETLTRLVLIDGGLPRPHTQIAVRNGVGYPFARIDMGWPQFHVGVEYDGTQHWIDPAQRTSDIDRLAELEALGWPIIRVGAELLRNRPSVVVDRATRALRAAGWRGEMAVSAQKLAS